MFFFSVNSTFFRNYEKDEVQKYSRYFYRYLFCSTLDTLEQFYSTRMWNEQEYRYDSAKCISLCRDGALSLWQRNMTHATLFFKLRISCTKSFTSWNRNCCENDHWNCKLYQSKRFSGKYYSKTGCFIWKRSLLHQCTVSEKVPTS